MSNLKLKRALLVHQLQKLDSSYWQAARTLLNLTQDAALLLDRQGLVLDLNTTAADILRQKREQVIGTVIWDYFPHDVARYRRDMIQKVFDTREPAFEDDQDRGRWYRNVVCPVLGPNQKVQQVAVLSRDITDRRQTIQALHDSEERYRSLVENMSSGVAVFEAVDHGDSFVIRDWNRAAERIERIEREALLGRRVEEAFPSIKEFGLFEVFQRVWRSGLPEFFPLRHYQDERISGWRENSVYKLPSGEIVAVFEDVTERMRNLEKLQLSRQQLFRLATELTRVEDRERRQLATCLHDDLGQLLAVLKMKLVLLGKSLDKPEAGALLAESCGLVDKSIASTRCLTRDLSPSVLYEFGLAHALDWLAGKIGAEHGLCIHVEAAAQLEDLDQDLASLLFRSVRELLMNVVKHAQACRVQCRLIQRDDRIVIGVEDDGVGIDPSRLEGIADGQGFGLFSIRERLKLLGGNFAVESPPGCGTQVTLEVPLEAIPD